MNIPNILTVIRLLLIPVFAYFLYQTNYYFAAGIFVIAGLTDVLDGYIARRFNMITDWGKLADPVADKLLQIAALVGLTLLNKIPWEVLMIVVLKESMMAVGSLMLLKKENHVVSANWYGKLATVIFYVSIALLILFPVKDPLNGILVWIAVIMSIFAFFMYYINTYRKIRKESKV